MFDEAPNFAEQKNTILECFLSEVMQKIKKVNIKIPAEKHGKWNQKGGLAYVAKVFC